MLLSCRTILNVFLCGLLWNCAKQPQKLRVAAASSMTLVFEEIAKEFTKQTGISVTLIFSSSGILAQQIKEGAPYDIFASAKLKDIETLVQSGEIIGKSLHSYARDRLVLWVNQGEAPQGLAALTSSRFEHIAIATPEHAPFGIAAKESLQTANLWQNYQPKIVRASNVRQAMQYVQSGNAEVAMIALSLAITSQGAYHLLDAKTHTPIIHSIGTLKSSNQKKKAEEFSTFLRSTQGKRILKQFGLTRAISI